MPVYGENFELSPAFTEADTRKTMANKETLQDPHEPEEKLINSAAFCVYGFITTSVGYLYLSATQDLLSGTSIPSPVLAMASESPYLFGTALLPYFVGRVPQLAVNMAIFLIYTASLLLMALPTQIELKVLGAACTGVGFAIGSVLFMGHTARYSDVTVHAYSAGSGLGFILSNLYYTGKSCESIGFLLSKYLLNFTACT